MESFQVCEQFQGGRSSVALLFQYCYYECYLLEYEVLASDTVGNTAYKVGCEGTGP